MATNNVQAGGIATFVIKVNGNAVPDTVSVLSVEVEKKVNRITKATLVILDGDLTTGKFEASSSSVFVPGNEVSIEAGYDGINKVIFTGIITGQNLSIDEISGPALEVVCHDAAIKMTVGRKCITYAGKTDNEIITSIIENYAGLTAKVAATTTQWPTQVQYDVTDWDYILSLAQANGLVVTTINGAVSVAAPANNTTAVLTVEYGNDLMEFNASLDAVNQFGTVNASAWDYKSQAVINGQAKPGITGPGNLSTKKLSAVIGLDAYSLQTTAALDTDNLTNWSKAQMLKSEFSKITGQAKFQGNNLVEPANYITMVGLGDRFSGDHFLSGVIHNLSEGNWITEVSLGMSQEWFMQQTGITTSAVRGLLNGTVKKIADDPDGQYRILVSVPMFDAQGNGIWARLSNFYATSGAGAFFLPEIGDEVVVGFLNEDPRFPVVLGSMYSSTTHNPFAGTSATDENRIKAIVSRSGINIQFDDMDKTLTICTPANNSFVLNDKDKQVTVKDENGNSVVMGPQGISITSIKDINLKADQKINIQGSTGVSMHADGGNVDIKAVNINETADSAYSAQGSTLATLSAGNILTLKGALIKIN